MSTNRLILFSISFIVVCSLCFTNNIVYAKGVYFKEIFKVNGVKREYWIYIPKSISVRKKHPAVVAFHGYESDANGFRWLIKPDKYAEKYGYIMIYPNAIKKSWNAGKGFGSKNKTTDDLSFVAALLDVIVARHPINKQEIFAMGFSNGAQMVSLIACHIPHKIKAGAMVAQTMNIDVCPKIKALPMVLIHGQKDKLAPFYGGGKFKLRSHNETVEYFQRLNYTDRKGKLIINKKTVKCIEYNGKAKVLDCICYDSGHTWPGGTEFKVKLLGKVNREINANEVIFSFFKQYRKSKHTNRKKKKITLSLASAQPTKIKFKELEPSKYEQILDAMSSSLNVRYEELSIPKNDTMWRDALTGLSGGLSFSYPIKKSKPLISDGLGNEGKPSNNMALSASLKYSPISYWFFNVTFYKFLNNDLKAPWHPDFSYTFGYNDWHPYTFSFMYSNYGGNRLFPDLSNNETFTNFWQGSFSIGWKFPCPDVVENWFVLHKSSGIGHGLNLSITPEFMDSYTKSKKNWKTVLSFSTKYTIYKWWYVNFGLYYYFDNSTKQPWNPDFTYGFGYFDWHVGTISIQYNNYAGNRFPWNAANSSTGTFESGGISIIWSWSM